MALKGKDIITLKDITKEDINFILENAEIFEEKLKKEPLKVLEGKILATIFLEPSTRTRLSFESAMHKLGGRVLTVSKDEMTSLAKGENLSDMVRVIEGYCDVITIRTPIEGAPKMIADRVSVPVINGGDGAHAHPTQPFLDLYTMKKEFGKLEGLKVAIIGDLKYGRTVHSLVYALAMVGVEMVFVSPEELRMPSSITKVLKNEFGIEVEEKSELEEVIPEVDVLYMTRIQRERFPHESEYEKVRNIYRLDSKILKNAKEGMKILHPLPRIDEIAPELDATKYACYFSQAHNGVPVRMAILAGVLGKI
ncbi:MAG: aspartate carbamoyltransferase [archaeon]|jgi:aspartate carbamoyltransferase catalytic subunit|nr:aspartate carbamoyltransferase [archaeon]